MHVAISGPLDLVWDEHGLALRRGGTVTRATVMPNLGFELVDESWLLVTPSGRRAWASTPLFTDPESGGACVVCDLQTGAVGTARLHRRAVVAGPAEVWVAGMRSTLDRVTRRIVRSPLMAFIAVDADDELPDADPPSLVLPMPITAAWPREGLLSIWRAPRWSSSDWSRPIPRRSVAGHSAHDPVSGLVLRISVDRREIDLIRVPTEDGEEARLDAVATEQGILVCSSHGKGVGALLHFDRGGTLLGGHPFSGLATPPVILGGGRALVAIEMSDDTSRLELIVLDLSTMERRAALTTPLRATNGYPCLAATDDGSRVLMGDGRNALAGRLVGDAIELAPLDLGAGR